jgi:hypothetical protein
MTANVLADLVSIFSGHVDVSQYNVGLRFFKHLDSRVPIVDFDDPEISIRKCLHDETPDRGAVIG